MDIKATLDEISGIEREKAQLELRQTQLSDKQDELAKRLAELGVAPKNLEAEISQLENGIREKLDAIRKGPIKTQQVGPAGDPDVLSAVSGE